MRSLLVAFGLTSLAAGVAVAGINPGNPGLPYRNNQSAICIDCHTVAPGGGAAHYGSHFVYNPRDTTAAITNSGGGWTGSRVGTRNGGEYFKVTVWGGGANKFSKYGGGSADNNSYAGGADNITRGAAITDATEANYSVREIICESCHNVISNVAGGNNLVAPMSSATYTANTGDNVQVVGNTTTGGNVAGAVDTPLCVGCHGYMYANNDNNTANTARYGDTRNNVYSTTTKKQNNHFHYINGVLYAQNHHVGTGDQFNGTQAGAGLLWRDVLVVPPDAVGTVDTAAVRGQVPQRATWAADGGKPTGKSGTNLTCIACHSAPHSGLSGTGASILRDTDADTTMPATRKEAIARIGETLGGSTRTWMGFSDVQYCNDCHTIR